MGTHPFVDNKFHIPEKVTIKEWKDHKDFKIEKYEKIEKFEHKEWQWEVQVTPGVFPHGPGPVELVELAKQRIEQIEAERESLRHFIEQSERPDLGKGALKDEEG